VKLKPEIIDGEGGKYLHIGVEDWDGEVNIADLVNDVTGFVEDLSEDDQVGLIEEHPGSENEMKYLSISFEDDLPLPLVGAIILALAENYILMMELDDTFVSIDEQDGVELGSAAPEARPKLEEDDLVTVNDEGTTGYKITDVSYDKDEEAWMVSLEDHDDVRADEVTKVPEAEIAEDDYVIVKADGKEAQVAKVEYDEKWLVTVEGYDDPIPLDQVTLIPWPEIKAEDHVTVNAEGLENYFEVSKVTREDGQWKLEIDGHDDPLTLDQITKAPEWPDLDSDSYVTILAETPRRVFRVEDEAEWDKGAWMLRLEGYDNLINASEVEKVDEPECDLEQDDYVIVKAEGSDKVYVVYTAEFKSGKGYVITLDGYPDEEKEFQPEELEKVDEPECDLEEDDYVIVVAEGPDKIYKVICVNEFESGQGFPISLEGHDDVMSSEVKKVPEPEIDIDQDDYVILLKDQTVYQVDEVNWEGGKGFQITLYDHDQPVTPSEVEKATDLKVAPGDYVKIKAEVTEKGDEAEEYEAERVWRDGDTFKVKIEGDRVLTFDEIE
jgi:hypothetical protein